MQGPMMFDAFLEHLYNKIRETRTTKEEKLSVIRLEVSIAVSCHVKDKQSTNKNILFRH